MRYSKKHERIIDYATNVGGNAISSFTYVWGLFIPCAIIATLVNPYMWKILMDGNIVFRLTQVIKWSIGFAVIVSILSTVPAYLFNFDYDDIDCGYPVYMFWKWGQEDQGCVERRKTFGNIVIATGVFVIVAYILLNYKRIYGSFKLSF